MDEIWSLAKSPMFSLTEKSKQLGLGKKGVTKYFSSNCDQVGNNLNKYGQLQIMLLFVYFRYILILLSYFFRM
jgi:hypothetical protein